MYDAAGIIPSHLHDLIREYEAIPRREISVHDGLGPDRGQERHSVGDLESHEFHLLQRSNKNVVRIVIISLMQ